MVPLIDRDAFSQHVAAVPKLQAFQNLIYGRPVVIPSEDLKEVDEIYYTLLHALSFDSKGEFDRGYQLLTKRKVNKDSASPFIHDDALIMTIIVGVFRFNYSKQWITDILDSRSSNTTTDTFKALLKTDFHAKSNLPQIAITFMDLCHQMIPESFIAHAYRSLTLDQSFSASNNDFLKILSLRAYDYIIASRNIPDGKFGQLQQFEVRFLARTSAIAWIIYYLALGGVIFLLYRFLQNHPQYNDQANMIVTVFSLLGISVGFLPILREGLRDIIRRSLGFKGADGK